MLWSFNEEGMKGNNILTAPETGVNSGAEDVVHRCGLCGVERFFRSPVGLTQHLRQAHPEAYIQIKQGNDEKQRETARPWNRWRLEELKNVVKMERLAYKRGIRNINQYLADQMCPSVDSISKKTRETIYKELREGYVEEERMELRITPAAHVVTSEPSSTVAATGKRTHWTAEELSIIDKAGPTAKAQDLIRLLPNRTIHVI